MLLQQYSKNIQITIINLYNFCKRVLCIILVLDCRILFIAFGSQNTYNTIFLTNYILLFIVI